MEEKIYVAVVDDEEVMANIISNRVREYLHNQIIAFDLTTYTDGASFLQQCKSTHFDLIFLDIDMPDITGLDIAHKIRMKQSHTEMIFITNKDDLVYDTIRYTPLRFIRKSRLDLEFEESIASFLVKLQNQKAAVLFSTDQGKRPVNVITVMYIDVQSHKLTIHLPDEVLTANGNLSDVEKLIKNYGFIRIHNSYLVNFRYISLINQKSVILDNEAVLPLSRGKYQTAKMELMRFSRGI